MDDLDNSLGHISGIHRHIPPDILVRRLPQSQNEFFLHPSSASRIRFWLALFILGLVLSGVTAFPLGSEVQDLDMLLHTESLQLIAQSTGLLPWIDRVQDGLSHTNAQYPYLAYGTDWLAFAHLVIAAAFIGPWINPVRNKWVIAWGLIACAAVLPLALIAGPIRGIPFGWRLIDCSFGVLGAVPLVICWRQIGELERTASAAFD